MILIEHTPKPLYELGDLLVLRDDSYSIWEVVGYTCESSLLHSEVSLTVIYNLMSVSSSKHIVAEQTEVMLVCKAEYSYDYISQLDRNGEPPSFASIRPYNNTYTEREEVAVLQKPTPITSMTTKEKLELTDELLDRYNETLRFTEVDGEITEEYQEKLDSILKELKGIQF